MSADLYTTPVRLDAAPVREALATQHPEIATFHYVCNDCLCHTYIDRSSGAQVRVVRSPTSGVPTEVVGDSGLWLRVRGVASRVAAAAAGTSA